MNSLFSAKKLTLNLSTVYSCLFVYGVATARNYSQYSILVFNLDLTGKLGESGPNLDLGGVNLDESDPYLTSCNLDHYITV